MLGCLFLRSSGRLMRGHTPHGPAGSELRAAGTGEGNRQGPAGGTGRARSSRPGGESGACHTRTEERPNEAASCSAPGGSYSPSPRDITFRLDYLYFFCFFSCLHFRFSSSTRTSDVKSSCVTLKARLAFKEAK